MFPVVTGGGTESDESEDDSELVVGMSRRIAGAPAAMMCAAGPSLAGCSGRDPYPPKCDKCSESMEEELSSTLEGFDPREYGAVKFPECEGICVPDYTGVPEGMTSSVTTCAE